LDVHIGLKPAGDFLQPRTAPGKPLLERPEMAVIMMPDGTEKRFVESV
jgi:hypothetical protein